MIFMNKFNITKELVKIANYLDIVDMPNEANSLTKIAEDMMDEKFDPMVYNPDDDASDSLDASADDLDRLIDAIMTAQREGDLNDEDIASIMNILEQDSGRKSIEMSYGDDDDDDMDYSDDDFDMGPEKEPFDYDSPEDDEDMYGGADSRFPDLDEDDF